MNVLSDQLQMRPIVGRGTGTRVLAVLLALGTAYWLYHCLRILSLGLSTLGIDTFGATWGILVANTVHLVGISHVGIAISAAVRVLRLERYRSVARPAEVVTLVALVMAIVNLVLHLGRPDRLIVNVILFGKWHSPVVWSMTVFVLYFLASSAYLYLSLRRDLALMAAQAPRLRGLYRALSFGYRDTPEERRRHERALYWLALAILPIMISVHSVYGLLFGMISAKAGWYNPLQAPYFVLGAIVSGFSAITLIVAVLRRAYAWQSLLPDRLFRVFGVFLACMLFLYLYFMLSEHMTAQYLPLTREKAVSDSLLVGKFSLLFWLTTILGLAVPFAYLLVQGLSGSRVHVGRIAAAALVVNAAMWIKRYLLVVPAQYHSPLTPARPPVEYIPTHSEWVASMGSYVGATFLFLLLLRHIPLAELPVPADPGEECAGDRRATPRRWLIPLSLASGLLLIAWGVTTRQNGFAPAKWLFGMGLLVAIPLEYCLVGGRKVAADEQEA